MSAAEADHWAWLLVLCFVFGCNVLRILLPSFSSFVSGCLAFRGPVGRGLRPRRAGRRHGVADRPRDGRIRPAEAPWSDLLRFKEETLKSINTDVRETPGSAWPRFHVAAMFRLGVLRAPPPRFRYFSSLEASGRLGCEGDSARSSTAPRVAGGLGLPRRPRRDGAEGAGGMGWRGWRCGPRTSGPRHAALTQGSAGSAALLAQRECATSCPAVTAAVRGECRPIFLYLPEESDS